MSVIVLLLKHSNVYLSFSENIGRYFSEYWRPAAMHASRVSHPRPCALSATSAVLHSQLAAVLQRHHRDRLERQRPFRATIGRPS